MGFTKLDEGILQSSVMAEDSDTFKVWISLLAACRDDGIARVSPVYLASVCHLSIETVAKSLGKLKKPDPYSRTKDSDGIRVREVDGGFEVVNYLKYRARSVSEYERERKRQQRLVPECPGQSGNVPGRSASASASDSASSSEKEEEWREGFKSFWEKWPRQVHKEDARDAYLALRRAGVLQEEIMAAAVGYFNYLRNNALEKHREYTDELLYSMHLSTFLRKNRWREYIGVKRARRL